MFYTRVLMDMLPIPENALIKLNEVLTQREIHKSSHHYYRKWLRYFLDFLVNSLDKKYPTAAKEFIWQWFFPQHAPTLIPDTNEQRRYHLHESHVQRALKKEVRQANYDIRTIQTMLGHADVRTTIIYTHCVPSKTMKEAKKPLDFQHHDTRK